MIAERPLGIGLATGLLVELVRHGRFLELRDGELFRTTTELPDDLAVRSVLTKMAADEERAEAEELAKKAEQERHRPRQAPSGTASMWVPQGQGWAAPTRNEHGWMGPQRHSWHPAAQDRWGTPPMQEADQHQQHGHDLHNWIAYLARDNRAEKRVIDRLSRAGLVMQQRQHRLLRRSTMQWVPCDTVVAGNPANAITATLTRRELLNTEELLLAGLLLATNLYRHALATLAPEDLTRLTDQLKRRLDATSRELLKAADTAVADIALL